MHEPTANKAIPTAPRALRELMEKKTAPVPVAMPPSSAPPPLPPKPAEPQSAWTVISAGTSKEPTPAPSAPVKLEKDIWRTRLELLATGVAAHEVHAKLEKEVAQLRATVQAPRFRLHPASAQHAILRRLERTDIQLADGAAALEGAVQRLQESEAWLTNPRKPDSAAAGTLVELVQYARLKHDVQELRAQVKEIEASVKELEDSPQEAPVCPEEPVAEAKKTLDTDTEGEVPMDVEEEEGEIVSPPGGASLTMAEGAPQDGPPDFDFDTRSASERLTELEERLAHLEGAMYQEQDDYKDRVDAYIEDKLKVSLKGSPPPPEDRNHEPAETDPNIQKLLENMAEYEIAAMKLAEQQMRLLAANEFLEEQNRCLRRELDLATERITTMDSYYRKLAEFEEKLAAHERERSTLTGPSKEDIIEAVLPTLTEHIRGDTLQALQSNTQTLQITLNDSGERLLRKVMPKVELTESSLEEMMKWLSTMDKTGSR